MDLSTDELQSLSDRFGGTWFGNWAEESGGSGGFTATVTIDPSARTLAMTLGYTGPLLQGGAALPDTISLTMPDQESPDSVSAHSSMLGDVVYTAPGGPSATLTAAMLPGNSDAVSVDLQIDADSVTTSYSVTDASGHAVLGALIVAHNRTPDPIDLAGIKAQRLQSSIMSGQY
ncbi:MAG TPA: hypothetical protein VGM78_01535, partial [Ilumatobacteraceae bacterium]